MNKLFSRDPPPPSTTISKDSLQTYCRLKPISPNESSCIEVVSDTTVQLSIQDAANNRKIRKRFTFKRVLADTASQNDIFDDIALPLLNQLVDGKNSLLFTYGVTGSGKTYTMTGNRQNVGIIPRCLDILFNSINDFQAAKYVFKPDGMNGFEVQGEEEAERDRNQFARNEPLKKKASQEDLFFDFDDKGVKLAIPEEDNAFAVFVTYIEVYNNYIYDLLDDPNDVPNNNSFKLKGKVIREDASGVMYVHGVTEVEVKSAEEAFEIFHKGHKRKHMAQTNLNMSSSRSHSMFTIRLVQAPLDNEGETVIRDRNTIRVSQLSLVDLAGSERTNRTNNTGQCLKEASKINQSLMTLRNCFEIMRKNQKNPSTKMVVPFRESRFTHLFKSFFEGHGECRMIVCVNPRVSDADENALVMQFAEASQDIVVELTPMKSYNIGLTPGRRRKRALQVMEEIDELEPLSCTPGSNFIKRFKPIQNNEESFKRELDALKALVKSYQSEIENLENKVTVTTATSQQRFEENEKLRIKIKNLEKEVAIATETSKQRFDENERFRNKIEIFEKELTIAAATSEQRLEEILQENEKLKNKIKNSEMEATIAVATSEQRLEEILQENEKLKNKIKNLEMEATIAAVTSEQRSEEIIEENEKLRNQVKEKQIEIMNWFNYIFDALNSATKRWIKTGATPCNSGRDGVEINMDTLANHFSPEIPESLSQNLDIAMHPELPDNSTRLTRAKSIAKMHTEGENPLKEASALPTNNVSTNSTAPNNCDDEWPTGDDIASEVGAIPLEEAAALPTNNVPTNSTAPDNCDDESSTGDDVASEVVHRSVTTRSQKAANMLKKLKGTAEYASQLGKSMQLMKKSICKEKAQDRNSRRRKTMTTFTPATAQIEKMRTKGQQENAVRYPCNTCNKSFASKYALRYHCKKHVSQPHLQCSFCTKKFYQKNNLTKHERIHNGERPYECECCKRRFTQANHLKQHSRTHAGEQRNTERYICHTCDKSFTCKNSIREHCKIHIGQPHLQCSFCTKKFHLRGNLNRHERIHKGERPFECECCKRKFTQLSDLKIHLGAHTGKKPYSCSMCKQKFNDKCNLKKHMSVTHGPKNQKKQIRT